ncbi:MAG: prolyl oligopeptidase family serine peptidase, partial [Candidatus Thorarchaeota archaeon]
LLSERIPRTRMCNLIWLPDNSGFYYTRFPLVGTVPPEEENYNRHVFFHRIGENYEDDVKVFGEGTNPNDFLIMKSNEDCTVLAIICYRFTSSDIYVSEVEIKNPTELRIHDMLTNQSAVSITLLRGKTAFVLTQVDAPNGQIVSYDLEELLKGNPLGDPIIIVSESESVISTGIFSEWKYVLFGDKLAVIEEKNACNFLKIYELATGNLLDTVEFDAHMTIYGITSEEGIDQIYFDAQSFVIPPSVYYYSSNAGQGVFFKPTQKLNPEDFIVKQVWCNSKDGTRVPMFLVHKKELEITAKTPVLLTGYGGFAISRTPTYGIHALPWIECGGIFADANLRGGMEFGQQWHREGNRENKQNVFDDFISAAEWLTDNQIGSRENLAIAGASNGGLLVGAALTQKPDLFKAVFCTVPLLDMVRYTGFEIAKFWIPEYGDPEVPEEFQWLYSYSPYHHVSKDKSYPAIFLETADGDSRVDPMHALKMAARLQQETESTLKENPLILWVESQAGHGADMSVDKSITWMKNSLLFLAHHTGLDLSKLDRKEE